MLDINSNPAIIRKKIKIYVDVILKDDVVYSMGQRLVSFFGQASIFENTESITEELEEFFEMISLNFLKFGAEKKFENDIFDDLNIKDESEQELSFYKNTIFLPLIVYFYYTEKRTDFFLLSSFKKRFQIDVNKWLIIANYLKLKEEKFSFLSRTLYINNIIKYLNLINFLRKFNKKNFAKLLKLTTTTTLLTEEFFIQPWDHGFRWMRMAKSRTHFYKTYRYKLLKNAINILKKLKTIPLQFLLNVVATKMSFLDEDFEYNLFLEVIVHFMSQLFINKKSLFRRLRRRRRFKKKLSRNFYGNKVYYYKIYAFSNNKKKKKK